ncbi:MAG TPA: YggS family pyridoxal phosphate-dependent enzyme [Nitrospirae bacterium]|nr:YggS family pyridoxal phosphate-dependent enzyme [Nitrospirota bacterium]
MSGGIIESISSVYKRISHAAMRAGRDPSAVKLVAVTKTVSAASVREAVDAGVRLLGESRVQEARDKVSALAGDLPETVSWHMIGRLQSNKARLAVRLFDMIQSVDSLDIARRLDRYASEAGKVQRVLVQVKLGGGEARAGVSPERLSALLEGVGSLNNIVVEGLMTIPPLLETPEDARPYFRRLREIRDEAEAEGFRLPELSMGMSGDFEVAVEEGATIVRVGTAVFGRRNYG